MKKALKIVAVASILAMVACGTSESDKAAKQKKLDSIAKADEAQAASAASQMKSDSAAKATTPAEAPKTEDAKKEEGKK